VKAAAVAPRPVDKLKPIVRCPTIKYNRKVRAGRGFSFAELKVNLHQKTDSQNIAYSLLSQEAGIPRKFAATIGISVDPRRTNLSTESVAVNVARLKAYKERLILFPRRNGVHKKGDSSKEELSSLKGKTTHRIGGVFPIIDENLAHAISEVSRSNLPKGEENAYKKLRTARSDARLVGVREKRAKAKAEEAAAKK
jgi:large subunit ribosomal protein L13e